MPVAMAALLGGRVSHSAMPLEHPSGAVVGSVMGGNVVGPSGLGGVGAALMGASVGSSGGGAPISLRELLPMVTHGSVATGILGLILGPSVQAVSAVDPSSICGLHAPMQRQGVVPADQPTVIVNKKPLARVGDRTTCGA